MLSQRGDRMVFVFVPSPSGARTILRMISIPRTGTRSVQSLRLHQTAQARRYATEAATVPAASIEQMHQQIQPIERYPPMVPPSHKPADLRKSQLHRQYTSLLRSTPLMLLFQHNNLKAAEWSAIRRELALALSKTSASSPLPPGVADPASSTRIQTIQTGIFAAALRVVEFFNPTSEVTAPSHDAMTAASHSHVANQAPTFLSREAYLATLHPSNVRVKKPHGKWRFDVRASAHKKRSTPLHRLLHGPIAVLSFPDVTPEHLAAALRVLAPTPGQASAFPAPKRKDSPTYYEDAVQTGLKKLLLLGARVEGRTMDGEGVKFVGGLAKQGGLEGLRAQLVSLLQGVGGGITSALEGASRSLWVTMEGRRIQLEEEGKPAEKKEETPS